MSIHVFGSLLRPGASDDAWEYMSLDVGDVFTDPLNGATVTITGITQAVGGATSIAYTKTGTFAASPATLVAFKAWLMAGTLQRGSYRGGVPPGPQWPISEFDKAGLSAGELKLTI
jgi:hypothetical protein